MVYVYILTIPLRLVPLAEIWSQAPYYQELGPSIGKITTSRFYGETLIFGTLEEIGILNPCAEMLS